MRLFCGLLRHPKLGCPPRKPGIVKGTVHAVFGRYLLVTNTITGGVLLAAGDMIQQEIERYRHKEVSKRMNRYDWPRVGRMFFAGLIQGPPQHYFYKKLDAVLPNRDWKSVCAKIFLDETVASPICIVLFFCGVGIFEKDAYSEIWSEIKSKFWTVYAKPKKRVAHTEMVCLCFHTEVLRKEKGCSQKAFGPQSFFSAWHRRIGWCGLQVSSLISTSCLQLTD